VTSQRRLLIRSARRGDAFRPVRGQPSTSIGGARGASSAAKPLPIPGKKAKEAAASKPAARPENSAEEGGLRPHVFFSDWRAGANRLMPLEPTHWRPGDTVAFDQASGLPAVVAIGRTSMPIVEHAFQNATTPRPSQRENQMTAIADTGPGQLIRWHYLGYAVVALGVMTVAIVSHDHWFLNFVHVICGVLWTGIDLFMGFVIGPILRKVSLSVRREIIVRLVPRTLFLMPTLSIITGCRG
jgi:hypothetical protein